MRNVARLGFFVLLAPAACVLLAACSGPHEPTTAAVDKPEYGTANRLTVQTFAVGPGGAVPAEYTANGGGTVPKITWSGTPPETREIEVLIEDTDAPGDAPYVHLLAEGLDAGSTQFPAKSGVLAENSSGKTAYSPLNPPPGFVHHYHFEVIALGYHPGNEPLGRDAMFKAMAKHVVAAGQTVGTYGGG